MLAAKITRADGGDGGWLTVTPAAIGADETEAQALTRVATATLPTGASFVLIDPVTNPPQPSQAQLAARLVAAAAAACGALTAQVIPDQTHRDAYVSAAAQVLAAGGPPTADPAKTAFASMATALGFSATDFATVAGAVSAASMQLSAALTTLTAAARAAKTTVDLGVALAAFQGVLGALVAAIAAAGVPVTAPAPIVIAGLGT